MKAPVIGLIIADAVTLKAVSMWINNHPLFVTLLVAGFACYSHYWTAKAAKETIRRKKEDKDL